MKAKQVFTSTAAVTMAVVLVIMGMFMGVASAFAQGGAGDQDRTQDRDRVQDPSTHDGDEPIQDRDQLRDRIYDRIQSPDQDRDRIRATTSTNLSQVISVSKELLSTVPAGVSNEAGEIERNRSRVQVGVLALEAAQDLVGANGNAVATLTKEVESAYRQMVAAEEEIQTRNWFTRMFFGGDIESANAIREQLRLNTERMAQVRQYLSGSEVNEAVRTMLEEQLRAMEQEHERLGQVADVEASQWGVFSWRF